MQESCIMRVRYAKAGKNKRWSHHKQILMVSKVQCTITRSVGSLADLTQESSSRVPKTYLQIPYNSKEHYLTVEVALKISWVAQSMKIYT